MRPWKALKFNVKRPWKDVQQVFYGDRLKGGGDPCKITLPSLNVDRNPKSEMAISRHFSMKIWNRIDESLSFFKAFQMVITIGARTSKIAPRSSRYPPGSRSTFREGSVAKQKTHEDSLRIHFRPP